MEMETAAMVNDKNGEKRWRRWKQWGKQKIIGMDGEGTVMILTPNRLWNISKVCVMQDKLWKSSLKVSPTTHYP
jgi:hypothetical protein